MLTASTGLAYVLVPGDVSNRIAIGTAVGSVIGGLIGAWAPGWAERRASQDNANQPEAQQTQEAPTTPPSQSIGGSGFNLSAGDGGQNFQGATFNFGTASSASKDQSSGATEVVHPKVIRLGEIPREPPGYQLRSELLQQLELAAKREGLAVVQALTGLRGVGKTHLAAAYARKCLQNNWPIVAWISGEKMDQIVSGLSVLASHLGLSDPNHDTATSARSARSWLETTNVPTLLVIDNAEDPSDVLPWIPTSGSAQVVITTNKHSFGNAAQAINVSTYTADQAIAFLTQRTGIEDAQNAQILAEEVGHLPLALAQASWLIKIRGYTYSQYLEILRTTPIAESLQAAKGDTYPHGTAQTVLLAVEQVEVSARNAVSRQVLEAISLLSPAGVKRSSLTGVFQNVPHAKIDQALGDLAEASLISYSVDRSTVISHRLVQRIVRDHSAMTGSMIPVGEKIVHYLSHRQIPRRHSWESRVEGFQLVEQIEAASKHLQVPLARHNKNLTLALIEARIWSLRFLSEVSDDIRAISAGESLVADCKDIIGHSHPVTLNAQHALAHAYGDAGFKDEALTRHQELLKSYRATYGSRHSEFDRARHCLAKAYNDEGRTAEALSLHQAVLESREKASGPDHPDALASRHSLAHAYSSAGRHAEAVRFHERVLADRERLLGAHHPSSFEARRCLAAAYRQAGRTDDSLSLYRKNLVDQKDLLGPDHPDVFTAREGLARALSALGHGEESVAILRSVTEDRARAFGPDHSDHLTSMHNLGSALSANGKHKEAIDLYRNTLADHERVLGSDHPRALIVRQSLANVLSKAGQHSTAATLQKDVVAKHEMTLGLKHPRTLSARDKLADIYYLAGDISEAVSLLRSVLADRNQVLGADHRATLETRHSLAHSLDGTGHKEEALELHREIAADRERILGQDHPHTLMARHCLASSCESMGFTDEALDLHHSVLADQVRVLGSDHPHTLSSRHGLAHTLTSAGRHSEGLALHEEVFSDRHRVLGPDHPSTLEAHRCIASALQSAGRLEDAISAQEVALRRHEEVLNEDHPDIFAIRYTLGKMYASNHQEDRAIPLLNSVLTYREHEFGEEHPRTLRVRRTIEGVKQAQGKAPGRDFLTSKIIRRSREEKQ
ncbi:tetratricopeptide repeat protein [Streptomyces stelliscabiei]|uniref:tetratricopeptide repeat protein n=1 Tax=Streptomyces stelliscabiei TaxID=146820 RepID=UPI002FF23BD5